jgi:hypothetical protein
MPSFQPLASKAVFIRIEHRELIALKYFVPEMAVSLTLKA